MMVDLGVWGFSRRRASGLPDSATRMNTMIVAKNNTTMLMANRLRI